MPRRKRASDDPALKPVSAEILDQFVDDGPLTAGDIEAAMRRFKKALIERALAGELTHHLGYPAGATPPEEGGNKRNGTTAKSVHPSPCVETVTPAISVSASAPPDNQSELFSRPVRTPHLPLFHHRRHKEVPYDWHTA